MITLEGWADIMYNLSDASQPWMAITFCVLLVMIGSFFLLNVILAVIMDAFDDVDKNSRRVEEKKRKELKEQMKLYGIEVTSSEDEEFEPVDSQQAAQENDDKEDSKEQEQDGSVNLSKNDGSVGYIQNYKKKNKNFKIEPLNENASKPSSNQQISDRSDQK